MAASKKEEETTTTEKTGSATARTMAVLEGLSEGGYATLEMLSERTGLSKPTIFRFLKNLKSLGYVNQHEDTKYSLSLKMLNVGSRSLESLDLYEASKPGIDRLAHHFGETVHLAVMVEDALVYLRKVESKHPIRIYSTIGKHAPLYCTSLGKALLAWAPDREAISDRLKFVQYTRKTITTKEALNREMEKVRRQGFTIDAEEHEENIHCIGAPIFDYSGNVVAAVSVAWPVFRYDARFEAENARVIMKEVAEISRLLGYKGGAAEEASGLEAEVVEKDSVPGRL